jgi:hypothetical protein
MLAAVFLTTCQTVFSEMPCPHSLSARQTHRNSLSFGHPGKEMLVDFRACPTRVQPHSLDRVSCSLLLPCYRNKDVDLGIRICVLDFSRTNSKWAAKRRRTNVRKGSRL